MSAKTLAFGQEVTSFSIDWRFSCLMEETEVGR